MSLIKLANEVEEIIEEEMVESPYNHKRTALVGGLGATGLGALQHGAIKRMQKNDPLIRATYSDFGLDLDGYTKAYDKVQNNKGKYIARSGARGLALGAGIDHLLQRRKNKREEMEE